VTDYPAKIKPFYAKKSLIDGGCVQAFDLLVPGIGELIGGSVREDDFEQMVNTMAERGMDVGKYEWYLDLRKFGSGKTGGFGLGFDRYLQWVTGISNIRETCPTPRWTGNIKL
jgi:asparaginyl-tRNA synthetase